MRRPRYTRTRTSGVSGTIEDVIRLSVLGVR